MRILWFIDLEYQFGMRHGANLRFFNLSRELISEGHEVYFTTNRKATDDPVEKRRYLNQLIDQRIISGHFETEYAPPAAVRRMSQMGIYPLLVNRFLKQYQEPTTVLVEEFNREHHIDLCIFTNRLLLFLVPVMRKSMPTLIDWIDSSVLFWVREISVQLKRGGRAAIPYMARRLIEAYIEESYYGRRCHANLTVSPADKKCLDFVNHVPRRNKVLLNGVRLRPTGPEVIPVKNRLIFSGNMSFSPNHQGAVWFIDHVFPLLVEQKPDIVLVIAGAHPSPELLGKKSSNIHVTGFVEDLECEIAKSQLCVAPLVSGSGFKNKIIEAIGANRFVVATSRAVEFLDESVRSRLAVADTPRAMADKILACLDHPFRYELALAALRRVVGEEFTWANRARELLGIAGACMGNPDSSVTTLVGNCKPSNIAH